MVPLIWDVCNRETYRETKYINGCQCFRGVGEKQRMTANGVKASSDGAEEL